MDRRTFFRYSLAAGTAGIAGCGVFRGSGESDENYEPTAADQLAIAVGTLNKVALAVREFQQQNEGLSGGSSVATFDEKKPRDRLARARKAITTAEEAGEPRQADIEAVRQYADGVEGTVDAVVALIDAANSLDEAQSILDSDGISTDGASTVLDDAASASTRALAAQNEAATALDAADGDRLADLDAEYEAMTSGIDTLGAFVVGIDGLAVGYNTQVSGVDTMRTAQDSVDSDEFESARESFTTAVETFDDSLTAFSEPESRAADSLEGQLDTGRQRSRSLDRLAAGYVSMLTVRDHVRAAETALEEETADTARSELTAGSDAATTAAERFDEGASILGDEFTAEFETAQNRATAVQSLVDGYVSILDARDNIATAESHIGAEEFEPARTALADASTDAETADDTFASGQGLAEDLFAGEFETGRNRASALQSLSTGYEQLLDGRDQVEAGESAFLNDEYDAARNSFETGAEKGRQAESTFEDGAAADDEGLFTDRFDQATQRATVIRSLGNGYAAMVDGRQEGEAGRAALDEQRFDDATDQFRTADNRFTDAEETLSEGRRNTDVQFGGQLDRALCQVGHLRTAVDHFIAAAEAGRNRNRDEFTTEREAGGEALDRTDEC